MDIDRMYYLIIEQDFHEDILHIYLMIYQNIIVCYNFYIILIVNSKHLEFYIRYISIQYQISFMGIHISVFLYCKYKLKDMNNFVILHTDRL